MNLLWEVQNFDWFSMYGDDSKFYKEGADRLLKTTLLVNKSNDEQILKECLTHIPDSTGKQLKNSIKQRLNILQNLHKLGN